MQGRILRIGAGLLLVSLASVVSATSASAETTTFSDASPITINDGANASPYPSPIIVSGLTGKVADVNVTLSGFSHGYPDDVGIVLVGPEGQAIDFMDGAGGDTDASDATFIFDDQAEKQMPTAEAFLRTGTYRPAAQYESAFPGPAPASPPPASPLGSATLNGTFAGTNPNGTWNLYVHDFVPPDSGSISGGWSIELTTDSVNPDTFITSGPNGLTRDASPVFTFNATEAASFKCSLDSAAFTACSSPAAYGGLTEGPHSLAVQAIDSAQNADPSPATRTFTVDTVAPTTAIDSGPSGLVKERDASFGFSASETSTFGCKLDDGAFAPCTSPQAYSGLADGPHTFQIRATDAAGNVDSTRSIRVFTVDATPPIASINSGPSGVIDSTSASFGFSADEPATFECQLDGAGFSACTSPQGYTGLEDGLHVFDVRATDAAGNLGPDLASQAFTVQKALPGPPPDTTNPTATVAKPKVKKGKTKASISFTGADNLNGGLSFMCSLDGNAATQCTSPTTYKHLKPGTHSFFVVAQDPTGNLSAPATTSFKVKPKN